MAIDGTKVFPKVLELSLLKRGLIYIHVMSRDTCSGSKIKPSVAKRLLFPRAIQNPEEPHTRLSNFYGTCACVVHV